MQQAFWQDSGCCDTIPFVQTNYSLTQIYAPIGTVIDDAREVVHNVWRETLALTSTVNADTTARQAEGKLLRPALCLLAAGALGEPDLKRCARLAASYELIHIASLTHDDVVDHATLRRGQNSLNALWDDHAAILGGDYLVARALELLVEYDSGALIAAALGAMRRMAEGELRHFGQSPEEADEADCIALAESKTASLFAAACSAPALYFKPEQTQTLGDFGHNLGIAFQLVDDLLDLTQDAATLGKPACGDVTENKHTLPLYLLTHAMTRADREQLAAMRGNTLAEEEQRWIRGAIQQLEVDKETLRRAEQYINRALEALALLPESPCKESMTALAYFVLTRQA
ncbi:MAG TPA: polyprenyl synthetase family protein [Candidatus Hydrogenedentes bacterium]|nr:polyprenyl synthetase family protein [Candidatus Hydrogenedentota bacterium]